MTRLRGSALSNVGHILEAGGVLCINMNERRVMRLMKKEGIGTW